MKGRDALWQPGMDHAGIATQMVVERQLAEPRTSDRRDIGREAFVDKVWEWKGESGGMPSCASYAGWAPRRTGRESGSPWMTG